MARKETLVQQVRSTIAQVTDSPAHQIHLYLHWMSLLDFLDAANRLPDRATDLHAQALALFVQGSLKRGVSAAHLHNTASAVRVVMGRAGIDSQSTFDNETIRLPRLPRKKRPMR